MKLLSVGATDNHGEGVLETEGLGDFEIETLRVALLDAPVDIGGIARRSLIQHGRQCGAGVLHVEVEIARLKGFLAEERAAEIGFALDVDTSAGFDVLGEEFGEDDLLGEEFGADGDLGFGGTTTEGLSERKDAERQKSMQERAAHRFECLTTGPNNKISQRRKSNDGEAALQPAQQDVRKNRQ